MGAQSHGARWGPAGLPVVVTVPAGTAPGEYLTSVVLENEEPVRGGDGGVALEQVVRQAVAVAVRVPGPAPPALSIAAASHTFVAERSVVAVDVANPGALRLTPVANLVVRDAAGAEVSRAAVTMDSFYAGTATALALTVLALAVAVALILAKRRRTPARHAPRHSARRRAPVGHGVGAASVLMPRG